jgi:hypothetical protein
VLLLYRRRWGLFYLPVVAVAALLVAVAAGSWFPVPPTAVTLAAGVPNGGYMQMALRYRDELAQRGILAEIVSTPPGGDGPLQRLSAAKDPAQVGFAHGLLAPDGPQPVRALAVIGKQPVWVFTHQTGVINLQLLRGLKVAAGPPGSATRRAASMLLGQAQLKDSDVTWVDTPQAMAAANDLLEQRVDAMVVIGSADAPTVRLLARSPGISMIGVERANALAAREPRLRPVVLSQGAIELRGDVPPRDVTLLHAATHLLVREEVHPALQRALLDAAADIHANPSFLQRQAEFPDFRTDFPLSPVAQRHALGSRPWLETVLPYWWAQLAELLLFAVLPIMALTALALVWIPHLFSFRVNALLSHYYGELKFIENDMQALAVDNPIQLKGLLGKLDTMEHEVATLDLPDPYADRWYTLREHLAAARERLLKLRAR